MSNRSWGLLAVVLLAVTVGGGAVAWAGLRPGPPLEISLPAAVPSRGDILIEGSVLKPGLYPYSGSDTIDDLIQAAGGATDEADPSRVELRVPAATPSPTAQLIDVNRAEDWLLEALPGIGEARAQAIVDHREREGPFRSIDELTHVTGIGDAVLDRIRSLITVSD